MARYQIPPTKTNLIKTRRTLSFAREGYELLDQKRQILVAELMGMMGRARDLQGQVERRLGESYQALNSAVERMGKSACGQAADAVSLQADISLSSRKVMGVEIPLADTSIRDDPPYYSLLGTSVWLDIAFLRFRELLPLLARLAQLKVGVLRLAREVKKTVRRVNSLEKIAIPDQEETIKYIEGVLEEQERENLFILKLIKGRMTQQKHR